MTQTEGARLKEGGTSTRSLLALGTVIRKLGWVASLARQDSHLARQDSCLAPGFTL